MPALGLVVEPGVQPPKLLMSWMSLTLALEQADAEMRLGSVSGVAPGALFASPVGADGPSSVLKEAKPRRVDARSVLSLLCKRCASFPKIQTDQGERAAMLP